jgi:Peptidase family S41
MRLASIWAFFLLQTTLVMTASAQSLIGRALQNAQPPASDTVDMWRTLTKRDVEAAFVLVNDNHPGALPEIGDGAFREALVQAHALARLRAEKVTGYEGYVATMEGFMRALGDKHVWARPLAAISYPDWAGLITSKQENNWVVTDEDAAPGHSLLGARLISCDGRPVDDFAREQLGGFKAVWSLEAQQIDAAPWLFVSERNPFVSRPTRCQFMRDGKTRDRTLIWRNTKIEDLLPRLRKATGGGAAGYGVRQVGDGYWIALEGLAERAPAVVTAVRAQAETMRNAKFVVLDLRGNGGGSSAYSSEIASSLFGKSYVEKVLNSGAGGEDEPCSYVWRATPDNIRQLKSYPAMLGTSVGAGQHAILQKAIAEADAALASNRALSGPSDCRERALAARHTTAVSRVKPPIRANVFVLTDHRCFSSCLIATQDFRMLGAVHVGETTDANTSYAEVRAAVLPSGLAAASTLMALTSGPPQLGPFVPAVKFDGDIADTHALERWIPRLAAGPH